MTSCEEVSVHRNGSAWSQSVEVQAYVDYRKRRVGGVNGAVGGCIESRAEGSRACRANVVHCEANRGDLAGLERGCSKGQVTRSQVWQTSPSACG